MKLKLGVYSAGGSRRDISLSCDVTTTVEEAALALVRSGLFEGAGLEEFVRRRMGCVTLLGGAGEHSVEQLLDPATPISFSGLQSGWQVTVVPEFSSLAVRPIPLLGTVEVLNGPQVGAKYSLVAGQNTVGRDARSRVVLDDRSVSRRHAVIEIGPQVLLRDLGSANGIEVLGQRLEKIVIERPTTVRLGSIELCITPRGRAAAPRVETLQHRHAHTRAPRVDVRFPETTRELPAPPPVSAPRSIPLFALLTPVMAGTGLFVITQNPMSLMMVIFTPVMLIGTWADQRILGKRKIMRELQRFAGILARERLELTALAQQEVDVRGVETPNLDEVSSAILSRNRMLWSRRPEHRNFLEVRFGDGRLRSRTSVQLPPRGEAGPEAWEALCGIEREFAEINPVPVLERFEQSGSIGVAGDPVLASGLARALVLQLAALHSPTELVIAAFAKTAMSEKEWDWLKWLPHIDPVTSPIASGQLACDSPSATRLLCALESLLEQRRGMRARAVRSHLPPEAATRGLGNTVETLPLTPVVVVLVAESDLVEEHRNRLISIAEDGPDLGVHMLWLAGDMSSVPAACRTFAELGGSDTVPQAQVSSVRQGEVVALSRIESVSAEQATILARSLSPVEDTAARAIDESDLPRTVHLRELHRTDLLGGAAPILQQWYATGSIMGVWRPGEDREPVQLSAIVGQGVEGVAEIDLRAHGPHALVGGTTGAGKSEFLQSWIMSLAANISPDRLTFLLVDYKGGAAFAECVDLPHTVGLVTDLSPHLVRRALTSLRAELRYREELLAEHGAKDLITMEQRGDAAAPPSLVIVIDEFAALVNEVPEFVDGVIDVAQRGRSLGLHLILATQRPAGVIKDNLRANTNLRVALRMADEADSTDVIGVKDAAFFDAETPGRGAIKTGAARLSHFQTGYVGGRTREDRPQSHLEIRSLGFMESEAWGIRDRTQARQQPRRSGAAVPRDIERLRDGLVAAASQAGLSRPRQPWLDMLPNLLSLEDLHTLRDALEAPAPGSAQHTGVLIGMIDRPEAQAQEPVEIDLDEAGSVAILGAGGTGKTSALLTWAASLSHHADRDPVHIYAIDAAGGGLDPLLTLPTVGAVASLQDAELTRRVLRHVQGIVTERGAKFAAARDNNLLAYRSSTGTREPRVVLMIDGFSALRQATEMLGTIDSPMHVLGEIVQAGRAVGVHVVLTADRAGVMPSTIAAGVQQQLVLRLASVNDYAYVDVPADALEQAPPGRVIFAGQQHEVQLAMLDGAADLAAQAASLEALGERLKSKELVPVPFVRNAPELIPLEELPIESRGRPVFGIETEGFEPIGLPANGLGVIAGPAGSGLSAAVLSCATAFSRWAHQRSEPVERVLLSFVPARTGGLGGKADWNRSAEGPEAVAQLARDLTKALGGKPPAAPVAPTPSVIGGSIAAGVLGDTTAAPAASEEPPVFPTPGARGVIVVERPTEAEGTEAMPMLIALAKAARRAEVLVLFEFEQGVASAVWELFSALKQPRWGLALQPDETDSGSPFRETFGRAKRADFPEGRGFAVEAGRVTPIQVALSGREMV